MLPLFRLEKRMVLIGRVGNENNTQERDRLWIIDNKNEFDFDGASVSHKEAILTKTDDGRWMT